MCCPWVVPEFAPCWPCFIPVLYHAHRSVLMGFKGQMEAGAVILCKSSAGTEKTGSGGNILVQSPLLLLLFLLLMASSQLSISLFVSPLLSSPLLSSPLLSSPLCINSRCMQDFDVNEMQNGEQSNVYIYKTPLSLSISCFIFFSVSLLYTSCICIFNLSLFLLLSVWVRCSAVSLIEGYTLSLMHT